MLTAILATIIGLTLLVTLKPTARQAEVARLTAMARGRGTRSA
jgi:hypothetical protein